LIVSSLVRKVFWIREGTHIANQINIQNGFIIEGGFDTSWQKLPSLGSTIIQLSPPKFEAEDNGHHIGNFLSSISHISGIKASSVNNFKLKDITLHVLTETTVGQHSGKGSSIYGIHLFSATNFLLSRIRILTGKAGNGNAGISGANGATGGDGGAVL
jgi:hypothetical protein